MPEDTTFNFDKNKEPEHFKFNSDKDDSSILFSEEKSAKKDNEERYRILIVDDDEDVHSATKLILSDFSFNGKSLEIIQAFSAKQARDVLDANPDIALMFLDVVMETQDAGLLLVKEIREEIQNPFIRIILRTGQPGYAPERKVVVDYDINDYKTKTELTANKVITVLVAGLRAYDSLIALNDLNANLQQRVEDRTHELQEKNELLDAANKSKNKLFSIIGHDLRGPIGNVKNMLEALVNQPAVLSTSAAQTVIKQLHKNAAQTYTLLDNLLLWARNEQGEATFQPTNFDLNLAIYESVSLLENLASDKKIAIKTNISAPNPVFADRRMVSTVLRNLVANAIKFSRADSRIQIQITQLGERARVDVVDEGVGISEEGISKILNPNEVYTTYGTKNEKGSGLGLSLSKNFIERNGGELIIRSEVEKGSTFSFTIPLKDSEP